jgi:hypothetical protein
VRLVGYCRSFSTVRGKTRTIGRLFALSDEVAANLRRQVEAGLIVRRQDSCVISGRDEDRGQRGTAQSSGVGRLH